VKPFVCFLDTPCVESAQYVDSSYENQLSFCLFGIPIRASGLFMD
jgi:hypothetical protein